MKNNSFYLIIILLIVTSCVNSYHSNSFESTTSIYLANDSCKEFEMSSLDSICVVELETNEESTFGKIKKVETTKNGIYVLDFTRSNVLKFSVDGKYQYKLKKGKGRGEIQRPSWFTVDDDGVLYVLNKNKVNIYDSEGSYMRTIVLKFIPQVFEFIPESGGFIFYSCFSRNFFYNKNDKRYNCIITDSKGDVLAKHDQFDSRIQQGSLLHIVDIFSRNNEKVYVNLPYSDIIYTVDGINLVPCFQVDFGNENQEKIKKFFQTVCSEDYKIKELNQALEHSDAHFLLDHKHSNTHIMLTSIKVKDGKFQTYNWCYNKQSGQSYVISSPRNDREFPWLVFSSEKEFFIDCVPTEVYDKRIRKLPKTSVTSDLSIDIDISDNPLIIKYNIK